MKLRNIKIVYFKELLDTIRDRRTLIAMVIVPLLLFPFLTMIFAWFTEKQSEELKEKVMKLVVIGKENAPKLYKLVEQSWQLEIVECPDPEQALAEKDIQVILEIPKDFELKVAREEPVELIVLFDAATVMSNLARDKVCLALEVYKENIITQRLEDQEIDGSILTPFGIREQNVASKEKMTGMILGMILPYIIILLSLTGAMYPAIDLTAGEKERGTMETLLVSPATRLELVIGKFLTVFTASIITALLATISMFVSLAVGLSILEELAKQLTFTIQPGAIFVMLILLVPVAMIFSALLIVISIFARSFKEAQSYISPLMILVIIPAVIPMMAPTMEISSPLVWVPIINVSLILKEIFTGMYNWGYIGLIFLSTGFYAAIALFVAAWLFQQEKVLFRT